MHDALPDALAGPEHHASPDARESGVKISVGRVSWTATGASGGNWTRPSNGKQNNGHDDYHELKHEAREPTVLPVFVRPISNRHEQWLTVDGMLPRRLTPAHHLRGRARVGEPTRRWLVVPALTTTDGRAPLVHALVRRRVQTGYIGNTSRPGTWVTLRTLADSTGRLIMPWLETAPMDQRERFIADHRLGLYTMTELCARYAISRKTGYKWLDRLRGGRPAGARAIGAARRTTARTGSRPSVAQLICAARRQHPDWGPEKLLDWLEPRHPTRRLARPSAPRATCWPARAWCKKRRRRRPPPASRAWCRRSRRAPNDLWTADFKGQFRTRRWRYCYPLTVADQHTRYLLDVPRPALDQGPACGRSSIGLPRYGLPRAIRTDNGVPFATTGIHGLSQLNVWWMRLGIQHQRILPGTPAAERRARAHAQDLKRGAIRPPRAHARGPAARLQSLSAGVQRRTAARSPGRPDTRRRYYRPSPARTRAPARRSSTPGTSSSSASRTGGTFRFKHRLLFLANGLKQHHIGLEEVDDGIWSIYFNRVLLARLDERDYIIRG